jgi:hypothetical protein
MNDVRKWIYDHEIMVLPTDKNLGYVCVKCEWYRDRINGMLKDNPSFKILGKRRLEKFLLGSVDLLDTITDDPLFEEGSHPEIKGWSSVKDFLLSTKPSMSLSLLTLQTIPVFQGIVKMKNLKLRPIVPATTTGWLFGPAAKLVSKALKPAIRSSPTIIESSKELAKALSQIKLPRGKRVAICTADVEAFYTNVPLNMTREIVEIHGPSDPNLNRILQDLAVVANERLLFKYEGIVYNQVQGLAMGVGCSPDIANLYAAKFEKTFPTKPEVLYFARYMDDVFSLVLADNEEAVNLIINELQYDCLNLIWSVSFDHAVFLDMNIWIDHSTSSIEFCPYRKTLNHFERIPWDSAHPVWMKRGTYVGELSRLAWLSSRSAHYVEATRSLFNIYKYRGYPVNVIKRWHDDYAERRWASRFDAKQKERNPLIIKSILNPVWEGINFDAVFHEMQREWQNDDMLPPALQKDSLILSRKKEFFRSMDYLWRSWNLGIQQSVEDDKHGDAFGPWLSQG